MPRARGRRTSRSIGSARAPTLWRQHLISGSVTTGQTISDLSPPAQTTTARPVKLLRAIIAPQLNVANVGDTVYMGTTVVTADALAANAVPDADADPAHPWHWWDTFTMFGNSTSYSKVIEQIFIKTARRLLPNYRYVLVINGDSANSGAVNFDLKLRLLWQL